MSSSNKIILTSLDNETFEVDEAVAREFQIVAHMIEDGCADKPIPITNVSGKILSKVIEFCKKQVEEPPQDEETMKTWEKEFIALDLKELFELILAANYLNVKKLIDVTSQVIADIIKDKMPEEVRTIFNIKSDFTQAEEAQIREENKWAFEGIS